MRMLEKIARAISPIAYGDGTLPWGAYEKLTLGQPWRDHSELIARVAVETIRELPVEIGQIGRDAIWPADSPPYLGPTTRTLKGWDAMISAILNEEPK